MLPGEGGLSPFPEGTGGVGKNILPEAGRVLRRVRQARGLTLKDVGLRSNGRLKPTAVAGYERAERSISVLRFCALCELYGVLPEGVLAEIVRGAQGRLPVVIDLTQIGRLDAGEGRILTQFIQEVRKLRGEQQTDTAVLRSGDIETLARAVGDRPEEFLDRIGPTLRRP
jgi:transcriptional regulator with XRE-family HTH domain